MRQEESYKGRQGNWTHAWPRYVKGNGQTVCAITDKPFEETIGEKREDVRPNNDAGGSQRQGGVDAAEEKVEEVEVKTPKDIQKAPPTKFPVTMRV